MRNYHGEDNNFQPGSAVIHVDDDGDEHSGIVKNIDGDLLYIVFDDGTEGWENCTTCYEVSE